MKRRRRSRTRVHETSHRIVIGLSVALLLLALLWAADVVPPVAGSAMAGLAVALGLGLLIVLLPGTQKWLTRRSDRDELKRWRKES